MQKDLRSSFRGPFVQPGSPIISEIVLTTMSCRRHVRYREGAIQRILDALPKYPVDQETFINHLQRAFVVEEEEGTYEYYGA